MHKKKFSKMYEVRSRLIHGQIDFSSAYSSTEDPKQDRVEKDIEEATTFATVLLIATLQELVKRNWRELRFSYLVEGTL